MTRSLLHGKNGMKAETPTILGPCSQCYDNVLETEEHIKSNNNTYMHIDCCSHSNCNGNYEDVWCMDCGADYNNGRL